MINTRIAIWISITASEDRMHFDSKVQTSPCYTTIIGKDEYQYDSEIKRKYGPHLLSKNGKELYK